MPFALFIDQCIRGCRSAFFFIDYTRSIYPPAIAFPQNKLPVGILGNPSGNRNRISQLRKAYRYIKGIPTAAKYWMVQEKAAYRIPSFLYKASSSVHTPFLFFPYFLSPHALIIISFVLMYVHLYVYIFAYSTKIVNIFFSFYLFYSILFFFPKENHIKCHFFSLSIAFFHIISYYKYIFVLLSVHKNTKAVTK